MPTQDPKQNRHGPPGQMPSDPVDDRQCRAVSAELPSALPADLLDAYGHDLTFERGDHLGHAVGRLEQGLVGWIALLADGRRAVAQILHDGDFVDAGSLDRRNETTELVALSSGTIRLIDPEFIADETRSDSAFARYALGQQSRQLSQLRRHAVDLACKTPLERLAAALLEIHNWQVHLPSDTRQAPSKPHLAEALKLQFLLRRTDLADYIGITPETLSRGLRQLRDDEVIEMGDGDSFRITSIEAMTSIAAGGRPRAPRLNSSEARD